MRGLPHESTRANPAVFQHAGDAEQAHTLLTAMEAQGELHGHDEQPESGGHETRIFTKPKK